MDEEKPENLKLLTPEELTQIYSEALGLLLYEQIVRTGKGAVIQFSVGAIGKVIDAGLMLVCEQVNNIVTLKLAPIPDFTSPVINTTAQNNKIINPHDKRPRGH